MGNGLCNMSGAIQVAMHGIKGGCNVLEHGKNQILAMLHSFYILLATIKFRIMKTRHQETKEHLKYCQEKLNTVPKKYKAYWRLEIKRCKKFLYGS